MHNESSIPQETKLYFSKTRNFISLIFGILLTSGIIFLLTRPDHKDFVLRLLSNLFFLAIGLGIGYDGYRNLKNHSPQLILNNSGIQIVGSKFYYWPDVFDIKIIKALPNQRKYDVLWFSHAHGIEKLALNSLNIKNIDLLRLIRIYRRRGDPIKS